MFDLYPFLHLLVETPKTLESVNISSHMIASIKVFKICDVHFRPDPSSLYFHLDIIRNSCEQGELSTDHYLLCLGY